MIEHDKLPFKKMMNALTTNYGKPDLDIEMLRLWWGKLKVYEFRMVSTALSKWIGANKKMPTIADVIELCKAQEQRVFSVALPRKYTEEEKQANQERLNNMRKQLGWTKNELPDNS